MGAVAHSPGTQAEARLTTPGAPESDPRKWRLAVFLALLALTFLLGCFPMGDFAVWWHLRTGQLILERGEVPRTDWFTYTNATRTWIDIYWLFQVGLALLYRIGGASPLVLLKAVFGTAVVALSLVARRSGGKTWPIVVAWLPAVKRNLEPALLVAIAIVVIATASGGLYAWAGEHRPVGFGERKQWFAHDACAFLASPDLPERIAAFNISQAAVCIAHTASAHKQFMDPRLELNSQETFERYLDGIHKLWRGQPDWEVPLGVDYARPDEAPALLIERGVLGRAADVLAEDPRWYRV
ncbi:MAG TPA: hypothetical protein VF524_10570, partial [Polyangia bacterium]